MMNNECFMHEMQPKETELKRLLDLWGLPHLYFHFFEQKLTTENILKLQPHHIKKLFKDISVGDQIQFEECLNKWHPNSLQKVNTESSGSAYHASKLSLNAILNKCANGDNIKKYYNLNGKFGESQRVLLIHSISNYINANNIPFTLADCTDLEKQIVDFFPGEQLEYYTNGKRGRLYNKLSNLRRNNKDIKTEASVSRSNAGSLSPEKNAEEIIIQMRAGGVSAEQFENFWKQCSQFRLYKIKATTSTQEILKDWPEYKEIYGYRYVNIDFEQKFPKADSLLKHWNSKKRKIENLLRAKITNSAVSNMLSKLQNLHDDSQNFVLMWALHYVLTPSPVVVTSAAGSKMRKKFTITDSQDAFALVGASMSDVEIKLKILQLKGTPIQPCLIIIGEVTNVKEVYVFFDGIKYTLLNVVQAVDICFKLFFVFNLKYPDEAVTFFKFVESYFYNLNTSKVAKVESLIADLKSID